MKKTFTVVASLALCASAAFPLTARANLLTNGGLEVTPAQIIADPSLVYPDTLIHASSAIHPAALTGWSIGGACIDIVPSTYWQDTQGSYSVDLIGTTGIGSISQTVSGLTVGGNYQLTFDFAVNPETLTGEGSSTKKLQISVTGGTPTTPTLFSDVDGTRTKLNMQYVTDVFAFTANSSSVTLTLAALLPGGLSEAFTVGNVYCGPVIDNLDLEAAGGSNPSPEPASLGILSMGGLMLMRRSRARKN